MRVLVVGGTGFIGAHLCRELHERGHEVTALSRSPEDDTLPADVRTAMGDVTAYDSIEGAFEGQDAVVNLVALSPLFRPSGGNEMHYRVHEEGTANVVRAAEEHGVGPLVQMSALGADPNGETASIRAKGLAEGIVRESDLEWVIFRPSVVFGDGGEFLRYTKQLALPYLTPLPGGGKTRFQPIWIGDIVPMLADAADGGEEGADRSDGPTRGNPHVGHVYDIGGPEVLTLAEIAELAHRADGRSVEVVPIPMPVASVGLKSLDFVPASVLDALPGVPRMGSDQYRSLKFDNTVDENDVTAFGVAPGELLTLAAYLADSAAE
ncbi:MAG: complex I NDUFA9 subunit family protein [Natronomonas sp.]|uniref:complex I NDUFA9 subunit family protein n=1 Tax=Natronomonas sp. TaxID=2184060 RepID=UPI00286FEAED|nr:complex I NDUFA9 subunit family protein [Natronomonas sp.]MDR9380101.1 complex I NDUFA9 subunit family protein [Natronomonas sp.]MDR9429992.1 complex I NDUFA9 subunit family protein [Natronomonas sp.]